MSIARRILKFLASLKLAVILLLSLSVILAVATYIESKFDAKTAAHLVYGSSAFSLFLFMLGVNVLCAALVRYPWKRHQTGFVIVHLGIIVILVGSFITRIFGFEGMMTLAEGEQRNDVTIDEPYLRCATMKKGDVVGEQMAVPAELRWNPPDEAHPRRFPLCDGLVAVVDRYIHNAQPVERYAPGDAKAPPAVHVEITAGQGAPMPQGTVMADTWLSLEDASHAETRMGPATLRLTRAASSEALEKALRGPQVEALDARDGVLRVGVGQTPVFVAVAGNEGREVPLAGTPYRLRIDRFLPFAVVKNNKLENRSAERTNPAVEITLLDDKGEAERHIVFAKYPEFSTSHHQARPTKLEIGYTMTDPRVQANAITFIVGPDGALNVRVDSATGRSRSAKVKVGETCPTGWRMNLEYTVRDFVDHAAAVHEFKPVKAARGGQNLAPAVHLTVEGADAPGPYWIGQGDSIVVSRAGGQSMARVAYALRSQPVGFDVKLERFTVGYDPGTRNAATYTSNVHVDDARREKRFDAVITMNEPLQYAGLTFFQASFAQGEGGTQISTLQVARDPGVPVKYAGSILLVLGIALYVFTGQPRNRSQKPTSASLPEERGARPTSSEVS